MKTCSTCSQTKPLSDFQKRKDSKDGLRDQCRACRAIQMAQAQRIRLSKPHKCGYRGCDFIIETRAGNCPKHQRNQDLKRHYGLNLDQYDAMLVCQGYKCAICGNTDPGGKYGQWHIDHNHDTGQVRSLLCQGCNVAIGMMEEDEDRLLKAVGYLRFWRQSKV